MNLLNLLMPLFRPLVAAGVNISNIADDFYTALRRKVAYTNRHTGNTQEACRHARCSRRWREAPPGAESSGSNGFGSALRQPLLPPYLSLPIALFLHSSSSHGSNAEQDHKHGSAFRRLILSGAFAQQCGKVAKRNQRFAGVSCGVAVA